MEGVKYISNPRPNRRGGGVAITLVEGEFTLTKLEVITPPSLEVVWGLVRPRVPTTTFKGIIVCSFYSVPHSKTKTKLVEHITLTYTELKARYRGCFFLMGGDKNDLDITKLLGISPTFHQHNTKPTYGNKNIDVLVSDFTHLYGEATIIPNVPTDLLPGQPGGGQPSDHPIVYCRPRLDRQKAPAREVVVKKTRRFDDNRLRKVAAWIQHESWEELHNAGSASSMAIKFSEMVEAKLDTISPLEEVKITKMDSQITSLAMKRLARNRLREYTKHGNSLKFKEIKQKQKEKLKQESKKLIDKEIERAGGKGMSWLQAAQRVSARPGTDQNSTFTLPKHTDENLTKEESAERLVAHFSKISQEFTPIELDTLPEWVETKLLNDECKHPSIEEHIVYQNMKKAKKTESVPGDIPAKILREFLPELASPITSILREAVHSHSWPEVYKQEYHIPIKKIPIPEDEDDIRGIGLTPWVSKQLERLVLNWIWPYIRPHVDPDQMGGMKGCSVEHYIVKMFQFILSNMDGDRDAAVLGMPIDYSKAFNRMLHSNILCSLAALNVPTCAVRLIKSYLTKRSMCMRYKGATSSFKSCPGGGPQGGLLTQVFFILQVNKAGQPCPRSRAPALRMEDQPATTATKINPLYLQPPGSSAGPPTDPTRELEDPPLCHNTSKTHKNSYIDDLTLFEKVSLKDLVEKKRIIGPLNYHDRFNLELPANKSVLQHQLSDLTKFTADNSMKLNSKKTKCIPFIKSKTKDFMPKLTTNTNEELDVVYELKLVGLVVTSDLTWGAHVNYTVARVNKAIWQLVRFRQLGATREQLLTYYTLKVRSILMFGAVCFHSSLSVELRRLLELQQKRCLRVILSSEYLSYKHACELTRIPTLEESREAACLRWARRAQASPHHSHLFPRSPITSTRHTKAFLEYTCRTNRYYFSAVPYMARLLNSHGSQP